MNNKKDGKNKKKISLAIATILSWFLFVVACCLFESSMDTTLASVLVICSLTMAIIFSTKIKSKKTKGVEKKFVDENVVMGRKLYKKALIKSWKRKIFVRILIYFAFILLTALPLIFVSWLGVVVVFVVIATHCVIIEFINFKIIQRRSFAYQEVIYNQETFVLFVSIADYSKMYNMPKFHVVYDCREYVETEHMLWNEKDNLKLKKTEDKTLKSLVDWLEVGSEFFRINIRTKKHENVQCIYKTIRKNFTITNQFEKLDRYFEVIRDKF